MATDSFQRRYHGVYRLLRIQRHGEAGLDPALDDAATTSAVVTYTGGGGSAAKSFQTTNGGNGAIMFGAATWGSLIIIVPVTVATYTMILPAAAPTSGYKHLRILRRGRPMSVTVVVSRIL